MFVPLEISSLKYLKYDVITNTMLIPTRNVMSLEQAIEYISANVSELPLKQL